jgi:hypothetical protein
MSRARDLGSFVNSTAAGKNLIINGNFDFWQRGVSFVGQEYTADRWISFANDSVTRQSFSAVPEVPGAQFYLRKTPVQTGGYHAVQNIIENGGVDLSGKTVTLSFWARRNTASDYSMNVFSLLVNDQQESGGFVTLTGSWTKYILTLNIPVTNGTSPHRYIRFNPQGDGRGFDLAQVQLELGSSATPFSRAGGDMQGELAKCQRYYEKSYNHDVLIQTNTTQGISSSIDQAASATSTNGAEISFRVPKRATPTIATYRRDGSASSPNAWQLYTGPTGNYLPVLVDLGSKSHRAFIPYFTGASGLTANNAYSVIGHWIADAEL